MFAIMTGRTSKVSSFALKDKTKENNYSKQFLNYYLITSIVKFWNFECGYLIYNFYTKKKTKKSTIEI